MKSEDQPSFWCHRCLHPQKGAQRCDRCDEETILDTTVESQKEALITELRKQAGRRRRKFVFIMEAMAIVVCFGFLYVAMTVAQGFGGGMANWAAKLVALGTLAACWVAIPKIYDANLRGRPAMLLAQFTDGADETAQSNATNSSTNA